MHKYLEPKYQANYLAFRITKRFNNIEGWGEATLSGKDNEIFKIKDKTFEIILNKIYTSPLNLKIFCLLKILFKHQ